jgi:hypothetical protein
MGRRHLGLLLALIAAVAVASAAAAATLRFTVIATGTTEPAGLQVPKADLTFSLHGESRWVARIAASQRPALTAVNFSRRAVVAVFLDGSPCATKVTVTSVTRSSDTLTVHVQYTPPPIGMATCVRTSTAYVVLTVSRAALGATLPAHARVAVTTRARA